jgi:hypothetical protein
MPDSPTSGPESDFVCDCEEWFRAACVGLPFYKEHEGKRYCVLHFPSKEKSVDFKKALLRKLESKDFDFRGLWFPDNVSFSEFDFSTAATFESATFSATADFIKARFSAKAVFQSATFSAEAYFDSATFSAEAHFSLARFSSEAFFRLATFSAAAAFIAATFSAAAYFTDATFGAEANFYSATFSAEAYFTEATFSAEAYFETARFSAPAYFTEVTFGAAAYFGQTAFRDYVEFSGSETKQVFRAPSSIDLQFAKIEKAERVLFHTVMLHPHWFVNIDPHRFDFINVHWNNSGKAKPELEILKVKGVASPHRLLAIACQRLAANCEDNSRYRTASHFRRMALDAERLETWRGFDFRRLNWWYWLASGYGEKPFQAFMVLLAILVLFGALYTQVGFARWEPRLASEAEVATAKKDEVGAPLRFSRALTYSAGILTFQRPEPKPATTAAQAIVLLETILGPVQAALLALAIRRKFMR